MLVRGYCADCDHKQRWCWATNSPDPPCTVCGGPLVITAKLTRPGWRSWKHQDPPKPHPTPRRRGIALSVAAAVNGDLGAGISVPSPNKHRTKRPRGIRPS